jgi:hypothetical protein
MESYIRFLETYCWTRYIKHLGDAMVPWDPASEFALLDADCRAWYDSLPASLQFTPDAMYIRKETSQLGALCLLHCAHYQTVCDLYRLGAPALYKLRAAFDFPPEQADFLQHLQQVLFDAARALATIIGKAAGHGPQMLADSWFPTIAYDSCRIMVYHLTQILDPRSENAKALALATIPLLHSNINALKSMGALNAIASTLVSPLQPPVGMGLAANLPASPLQQKQCLIVLVLSPRLSGRISYPMTPINQLRRKIRGKVGCFLKMLFTC